MAKTLVISVVKAGPIVTCQTDSPGKTYRFDFSTGVAYGLSGKPLQSTETIVRAFSYDARHDNAALFKALEFFVYRERRTRSAGSIVESLLSYPDLFAYGIDGNFVSLCEKNGGKLPKGYVAWLREKDKTFSSKTLYEFLREQTLSKLPQDMHKVLEMIKDGMQIDLLQMTNDKDVLTKYIHIINNSLKRYETYSLPTAMRSIHDLLTHYPQYMPALDDTKCASVAFEILQEARDAEKNKTILANEARLAACDGKTFTYQGEQYIVRIPSKMKHFTEEGKQQHNCVGHFYHGAMQEGRYLIYFLRKADAPDKSYVTCRYDPHQRRTVEHRLMNNQWFDKEALFTSKLDDMLDKAYQESAPN